MPVGSPRAPMLRIRYKNVMLKLQWKKYASQFDSYEQALIELLKKEGFWDQGFIY